MSVCMVGGLLVSSIVTGRIITRTGVLEALAGRRHGPGRRRPRPARHDRRHHAAVAGRRLHGGARPRPRRDHAEPRAGRAEQHRPVRHGRGQLGRRVLPLHWAARSASRRSARCSPTRSPLGQGGAPALARTSGIAGSAATTTARSPTSTTLPAPLRAIFEDAFGDAIGRHLPGRRAVRGAGARLRAVHPGGAAAHHHRPARTRSAPRRPTAEAEPAMTACPTGAAATVPRESLRLLESEVGVLIRRIKRVLGERARAVHPDLQPASYLMLAYLADDGPLRASAIAETFDIDKGAISRQVQHLVDLGLVDRTPDPADGRASLLVGQRRRRAPARRRRRAPAPAGSTSASATGATRSSPTSSTVLGRYNARSTRADRTARPRPAPDVDVRCARVDRAVRRPPPGRAVRSAPARPRCRPAAGRRAGRWRSAPRRRAAATGSVPQLSTTVTGPRRNASTSRAEVEHLDVVAGGGRERRAGRASAAR